MTTTLDFAHTTTAIANRERKAAQLAAACRELDVDANGIAIGGGRRREVWKAAGLTRAPSEETWHVVATLLGPPPAPATPPTPEPAADVDATAPTSATAPVLQKRSRTTCLYGCPGPVRQYMNAHLCPDHAPPPAPVPPAGTTAAEIRAERGMGGRAPSWTVLDDRAVASGKRRSSPRTFQAARAAEDARRARGGGGRGGG